MSDGGLREFGVFLDSYQDRTPPISVGPVISESLNMPFCLRDVHLMRHLTDTRSLFTKRKVRFQTPSNSNKIKREEREKGIPREVEKKLFIKNTWTTSARDRYHDFCVIPPSVSRNGGNTPRVLSSLLLFVHLSF